MAFLLEEGVITAAEENVIAKRHRGKNITFSILCGLGV